MYTCIHMYMYVYAYMYTCITDSLCCESLTAETKNIVKQLHSNKK